MEITNTLEDAVQERIAEVAYGLAEGRGFISGQEQHDWQNAERQVAGEAFAALADIRAGRSQGITQLEQTLHQRIAEVAYQIAQTRGFAPGQDLADWRAAEDQVTAEIQAILPGVAAEQAAHAGDATAREHNAVERDWETPVEVEIPAMNPD